MTPKNPENSNDDLEKQKQESDKIKDNLLNFGKDKEQDKKFLEDSNGGNKAVKAINDDIKEKSKSISPEAQTQINKKIEGFKQYTELGKLTEAQAKELSNIYKEIEAIEGTDIKKDYIQDEKSKEAQEQAQRDYSQKLLNAVEKLDKFLSDNHKEAQKKIENDMCKAMLARKNQKEPPSAYANLEIPTPQKESPNSLA